MYLHVNYFCRETYRTATLFGVAFGGIVDRAESVAESETLEEP